MHATSGNVFSAASQDRKPAIQQPGKAALQQKRLA